MIANDETVASHRCDACGADLCRGCCPDCPDGCTGEVCPCGCEGRIADHDDRSWGCWPCPICDDDSDTDLGRPCSDCAGKDGGR